MGLLMDIKVFNANLIRFVLIFNRINTNSIMTKSFFDVFHNFTFLFSTLPPLKIQMKDAFLCSLGIYVKPFPIRQYFDEVAG